MMNPQETRQFLLSRLDDAAARCARRTTEIAASLGSRAHFKSYGESALILDAAHWCKYLDYSKYLACIEEINFEIKRRFEDEGIEMAYPTQTVHLVKKAAASGD
jgi:small-conductance mechanosensitive channel